MRIYRKSNGYICHMEFPICFRFANQKTYIRIHSTDYFEEIIIIGSKYEHIFTRAVQYPEKMRIKDMIQNVGGWLEKIDCFAFDEFLTQIETSKEKLGS